MNALRFDELRFAARRLRKGLGSTIAAVAAPLSRKASKTG